MRLLEDLAIDGTVWEEGEFKGFPSVAIVEDDGGDRWMLCSLPVRQQAWFNAAAIQASGIITPDGRWSAEELESMPVSAGVLQVSPRIALPEITPSPMVHLHAHSEASALDGLSTVEEMVDRAVAQGQSAIAVTDHGVCAAHLDLQSAAFKKGVKPIFGIEAYLTNDKSVRTPEERNGYWHFLMLAKNERGLHNLWRASSQAHLQGLYYRPRMDWGVLKENSEGIIASTACLRGPLSDLVLAGDDLGARLMLSKMTAIYGDDMFIELHVNQIPEQIELNKGLVSLASELGVPTIAVGDSHYPCAGDKQTHRAWIAIQTNTDLQDEGDLFAGGHDYHLHSEDEVREALSYLPEHIVEESIRNTSVIADAIDVTIKSQHGNPVYHRFQQPGRGVQGDQLDDEVLTELCEVAFEGRLGPVKAADPRYKERLDYELGLIRDKRFSGYHLIVRDYCAWCSEQKILLGPGRGSAAGSLVCFLLGITQIDPVEHGLMFERYINPGRTELPDIDTDFPSSKRDVVTRYLVDRWGADHVVRVGTVLRYRNKSVIRDLEKLFRGSPDEVQWMDVVEITKIIDELEASTAGLGLPWDDLLAQAGGAFDPYLERYPRLWDLAGRLVGRLKSVGKHPSGIVVSTTEKIAGLLPQRQGESDDYPTTEFSMDALTELNFVKFDILTTRTLDTIQETLDLISADPLAHDAPWPHDWSDEQYSDPQVWAQMNEPDTLGIFQIETPTGTRMIERYLPESLAGLAAVLTLVRPGPDRSGLTDAYLRRRDGDEDVTYLLPELEPVLKDTYGCMIFQEGVMNVFRVIAGYSLPEADEVRSILGKKKLDKIPAERQRFEHRCAQRGVDPAISEQLFDQIAEFSRYSFNKAHALSYAVVSFWCAWLKTHYPLQFYAASLSTVKKNRIADFVEHARGRGYQVLPPDVNASQMGFTYSRREGAIGVRYGFSSIPEVGAAAAQAIIDHQPYASWEDFIERRGKKCNMGHIKILASAGAFDSLIPEGYHRGDLEELIGRLADGKSERCRWLTADDDPSTTNPNVIGCTFDWTTEVVVGKSGKPLKPKPLPKRCTKGCRQYDGVSGLDWRHNDPIPPAEIRKRERDLFGLYVSSTPFDDLDLSSVDHVTAKEFGAREYGGRAIVIGEVQSLRTKADRLGRQMAFLKILTPDGVLDPIVFSSSWKMLKGICKEGALCVFDVERTDRGGVVHNAHPIKES